MAQNDDFQAVLERVPLLPLKDVVIFPEMVLPVYISEDICLQAVDTAQERDNLIFLSAFQAEEVIDGKHRVPELSAQSPIPFDVYDFGTLASVIRTRRLGDGRVKVLVQGMRRAFLEQLLETSPYPTVKLRELVQHTDIKDDIIKVKMDEIRVILKKIIQMPKSNYSNEILNAIEDVKDPCRFSDLISSRMNLKIMESQILLGSLDVHRRLEKILSLLERETEILSMQEHFLDEDSTVMDGTTVQIKTKLPKGLDPRFDYEDDNEVEELRKEVLQLDLPGSVKEECMKQLRRLERMNPESSEAALTRTYVECLVDLPWKLKDEEEVDLKLCQELLDKEHYGLDTVKERIIEYLAVKKLNPNTKGPILCFLGPPGVGKTSLGKSIAEALGRKFMRISLGGVRDEAEVRGHRRTYVGAQPGRIVQSIRNAGVKNPVIMLDEIDKLGSDVKGGDPSSALLEVLDPEQNDQFSDHYVSLPFDLSDVVFLANANRIDTVNPPLRDRLEVIEVSGYSEEEKLEIARRHIIPKAKREIGVVEDGVTFTEGAIELLIRGYTKESGLRELERKVLACFRKIARDVAEHRETKKDTFSFTFDEKAIYKLLGEEKYSLEDHDMTEPKIGLATGLAYTSVGGEILELEVTLSPGKGNLILTGHLGDVMKESAQAALSFIRAKASKWGLEAERLNASDVHLHVPAGAVPKDGPSAGAAIVSAMVSALFGVELRQDIAVTGEISLHGRILPVGGLREKLLAALRQGICKVCVPVKNKSAINQLPESLRSRMDIRYVSLVEEVFDEVLVRPLRTLGATAAIRHGVGEQSKDAMQKKKTHQNSSGDPSISH